MNEKKKSLLVIALLLLVGLTAGYVSSTYAKYTGEVSSQGTATVAKWAFEDDNTTVSMTVNLAGTYDSTKLASNKVAPGTSGSFAIQLSNATSETGVDYTVTLGDGTNIPTNLKLYSDSTMQNLIDQNGITGSIAVGGSATVTIYWEWEYEGSNPTTYDAADTTDGEAATTNGLIVALDIVGVQSNPAA